jgi:hypothetical protein
VSLTIQNVRDYILDRSVEDNALELDLAFSDAEVRDAFKRAAREYNSIPPFVGHADPEALPDDTNLFLDATVQQLYISRLSRLQRNDMDYTAGGVTVDLEKRQIAHLKEMVQFHRDRFRETARAVKVSINLRRAYGKVG